MRNPCIDPADGIRDIGAIDRDIVADEEIFRDVRFNPLRIPALLLNRPSTIPHGPDLKGGFLHGLAERGSWKKDEKGQDEKDHISY
jgi:hypothetical protein